MSKEKRETDPRFYEIRNAAYSDLDFAKMLINKDPTIVHARNSIGETALHFLAVENDLRGVKFLFENGAEINTNNDFGNSALAEAMSLRYFDLVELMLGMGAIPDLKECFEGSTIFSLEDEDIRKFRDIFEKHGYK